MPEEVPGKRLLLGGGYNFENKQILLSPVSTKRRKGESSFKAQHIRSFLLDERLLLTTLRPPHPLHRRLRPTAFTRFLLFWTAKKLEVHFKNEKIIAALRLTQPNLKAALTLLSFVLVLTQGLDMINEFKFNSAHPNKTTTLNFLSEPFSVVVCFPIENAEGDRQIKEGRNSAILRNFSFTAIEKYSQNLSHSEIKLIEIHAGNKPKNEELRWSDAVLFKSSEFENRTCLSRCFCMDFNLDERFGKMSLTFLRISFRTEYKEVFLIERTQNFTSNLVNLRGYFYHQKVTKKYSEKSTKSNCRDYSGEEGCNSRRNCLDRCLSTRFIAMYNSIPTNTGGE